jgi:hypothetical protein
MVLDHRISPCRNILKDVYKVYLIAFEVNQMTIPVRPEIQAEARPTRSPSLRQILRLETALDGGGRQTQTQPSTTELAFRVFAAFRAHPHINNVLTHISRANWSEVARALEVILDASTASGDLSPLAQNIVDLMCAERGITGKIVKPYFHDALYRLLEPSRAERLIRHIEALFRELESNA